MAIESRWCGLSVEADRRPWDVLLISGSFLVVLAWAWRPIWDIDLFWHVVVGRLILEGGVPSTDVLSAAGSHGPLDHHSVGLRGTRCGRRGHLRLAWTQGLACRALGRHTSGCSRACCAKLALRALFVWASWALPLLMVEDRIRARPHLFELLFVVGLTPLLYGRERQAMPVILVLLMGCLGQPARGLQLVVARLCGCLDGL